MRVVKFWIMCHLSLGHEKKALLRTYSSANGRSRAGWLTLLSLNKTATGNSSKHGPIWNFDLTTLKNNCEEFFDPRPFTLDPRPFTLDPRLVTLDPRLVTLDPRPSTKRQTQNILTGPYLQIKLLKMTSLHHFNRNALKELLIKLKLKTRPEQLNIDKAD